MAKLGLTTAEAAQSKAAHGDNNLTEQPGETFWSKLLHNLGDPMIKILCVALIINIVFTILGETEWYESVGIAAAIIIATLVSTFSEHKNENAFRTLQAEASKIICKGYRDGTVGEIAIGDIVIGDALLLQAGDKVPADGRIIDGSVKVEQSALNGEPAEVKKIPVPDGIDTEKLDSRDTHGEYFVFRGSVVASGNAVMLVTSVGDNTMLGEIAKEIQTEEDRDTPLKVKLGALAKTISKLGYTGGILIAVALLFQRIVIANGFSPAQIAANFTPMGLLKDCVDALMLAVIIIVMAVPEGLPMMISLVSSLNMGKMLKENVLVRKLAGIETAGSLNILFSDKTGTITKGQLEVVLFSDGLGREFKTYESIDGKVGDIVSYCINENATAMFSEVDGVRKAIGGNFTERAVLEFTNGIKKGGELNTVTVLPFNSDNKYSATTVDGAFSGTVIKGAPERLIPRCKYYLAPDGRELPIGDNWAIDTKIDELAVRAIRVLALAYSKGKIVPETETMPDDEWVFVGILGIRDEVRAESVDAIREVQNAGIQVVMITGDRKETAVAIARDAGLLKNPDDLVLTSAELNEISDEDMAKQVRRLRVVARALPSDKSRLVRICQSENLVVGMTGDGVNDSPALKAADIGFAMGSGTEVAKEASDIIVMDDNFNSIDKAILYGRTIYNNIKKFIVFQLTINISAVLISFIAPFVGIEHPLTITQILWINLIMDTLAALAFGGEPALKRYMKERPKTRGESILSKDMISQILTGGIFITAMAFVFMKSPVVSEQFRTSVGNANYLMTGFFAMYVFSAVFNAFNSRTDRFNIFENITTNKNFLRVMGLIVVIQAGLVYLGGAIFNCFGLDLTEWLWVIGFALLIVPVDLIRKSVRNSIESGQ
jgi:calcium-translocating P-type ATPase